MSLYNSLPTNCIEIAESEYWRLAAYEGGKPIGAEHREVNVVFNGVGKEIQSFPLFTRAGVPCKAILTQFEGFYIGAIMCSNSPTKFLRSGIPPMDSFYERYGTKGEF